jgi:phosphatidylglycerophosphate synthase
MSSSSPSSSSSSSQTVTVAALVLAPERERVITGLTLGERGRRVAVKAEIPASDVHVVRSVADLDAIAPRLAGRPLLLIRATDQLVAAQLIDPLRLAEPGRRASFDVAGKYVGALRVDADQVTALITALRTDFAAGEAALVAGAEAVTVDRRARIRVASDDDVPAANAWQFELVNKPLDAFLTRKFWRPVSRPFTKVFLRLPLTPNMISTIGISLAVVGAAIATDASYGWHLAGMLVLLFSAILDNVDGEIARLRLEGSQLGGWLDTIGDDVARVAIMTGIGLHVAAVHPDLPIKLITVVAIGLTLIPITILYYYCVFIAHTYNNQDFTKDMGVGPGVNVHEKKTFGRVLGDLLAQAARRDFLDLGIVVFALFGVSELSFLGLAAGAVVGPIVIVPTFIKILRRRRAEAAAAALA